MLHIQLFTSVLYHRASLPTRFSDSKMAFMQLIFAVTAAISMATSQAKAVSNPTGQISLTKPIPPAGSGADTQPASSRHDEEPLVDRDVSWWFEARVDSSNRMAQAANFINTHRNIFQSAYIFVPGAINAGGNWSWPDQTATNSLLAPVANTGVGIVLAINIDESVMMSGAAPRATSAMASWLTGIKGASGFMIDYEPQDNYTRAHRDTYAFFLKSLANAMHAVGKTAHMCVGGNDFLDPNSDFSQWADTGVDRIMSMGITYKDYYGRDVRDPVNIAHKHPLCEYFV